MKGENAVGVTQQTLTCHMMCRYVVVAEKMNEVMCRRSDFLKFCQSLI